MSRSDLYKAAAVLLVVVGFVTLYVSSATAQEAPTTTTTTEAPPVAPTEPPDSSGGTLAVTPEDLRPLIQVVSVAGGLTVMLLAVLVVSSLGQRA